MTMPIPIAHARRLDEEGYVRLDGFIAPARHRRIVERIDALFAAEGDAAGAEFRQEPGARRLANLADKGDVFIDCVVDETVGPYLAHVLGPRFKLSSLNARSAEPRNGIDQPLHADGGSLPDERGSWVCNTAWMLDDFTPENGAIRIVPGSHRAGRLPEVALADPRARHPDQVVVSGRAGDVVVFNAHLWHGGLANRTDRPRLAMHAYYCRWDKPQQQHQKPSLRPEVQARLTPAQRLVCALDDPLNDELSSAGQGRSGFMK